MKAGLKKVIVQVIEDSSLLKKTEDSHTASGKVISVGPGCECGAVEDEEVVFSGMSGRKFMINGKEHLTLNDLEVLTILEEGDSYER